MSTNSSSSLPPGLKALPCTRQAEFAAYDSLPAELRLALHSTPLPISAVSVYETLQHAPNKTHAIAKAIKDFAWNNTRRHPMAPNYPLLEPNFPPQELEASLGKSPRNPTRREASSYPRSRRARTHHRRPAPPASGQVPTPSFVSRKAKDAKTPPP